MVNDQHVLLGSQEYDIHVYNLLMILAWTFDVFDSTNPCKNGFLL